MCRLFKNELFHLLKQKEVYIGILFCLFVSIGNVLLTWPNLPCDMSNIQYITFMRLDVFEAVSKTLYPAIIVIFSVIVIYLPIDKGVILIPLLQGYKRIQIFLVKLFMLIGLIFILLILQFAGSYLTAALMGIHIFNFNMLMLNIKTYSILFILYTTILLFTISVLVTIKNLTVSLFCIGISLTCFMGFDMQLGSNAYVLFTHILASFTFIYSIHYKDIFICVTYCIGFIFLIYRRLEKI